MKKNKLLLSLIFISIVSTFFIYNQLPENIPRHWSFTGEIDAYWGKEGAIFTALLPLVLYLLMKFIPKIDPKKESYKKHKKAYNITIYTITIFMILLHWVVIYVALGNNINVGLVVNLGVGGLFIIIGNYMGQIRHNYFFGIRNPWTLANKKVWKKTHQVGRYGFVILGFVFIIAGLLQGIISIILIIVSIIAFALLVTIYPYLLYKKLKK